VQYKLEREILIDVKKLDENFDRHYSKDVAKESKENLKFSKCTLISYQAAL